VRTSWEEQLSRENENQLEKECLKRKEKEKNEKQNDFAPFNLAGRRGSKDRRGKRAWMLSRITSHRRRGKEFGR
jgi:hypothetical protein